MYHCKDILCLIVFFAICKASKKNPPLEQLEGPWTIRNASENAVPILGNCPSMNIESSQKESSSEGVILFKSTIQTFTFTVVSIDKKVYQLFYPNGSDLLGNVSLLHAEKNDFLITELQTEGQTFYAVLTKENQTTPDTNKNIDKVWKSSKPTKKVSLTAIDYDNCTKSQEEANGESTESTSTSTTRTSDVEQKLSTERSDVSISSGTTQKISTVIIKEDTLVEKSSTVGQQLSMSEAISTATPSTADIKSTTTSSTSSISTPKSTQTSPDKIETLPIVAGNDTIEKSKLRNSAESKIFSSFSSTIAGVLFLWIVKTLLI